LRNIEELEFPEPSSHVKYNYAKFNSNLSNDNNNDNNNNNKFIESLPDIYSHNKSKQSKLRDNSISVISTKDDINNKNKHKFKS